MQRQPAHQQTRPRARTRIGIDGLLIIAGMALSAILQASGSRTAGAAVLGVVVAGSWLNLIRYMKAWRELRRQIMLESGALAFLLSLAAAVAYTAVAGVMDCDCAVQPLAAEGVLIASLAISAAVTWLRYR